MSLMFCSKHLREQTMKLIRDIRDHDLSVVVQDPAFEL